MRQIDNIQFYTLSEVSERLGIEIGTLRRYITQGKVKAIKLGRYLIREEEVKRIIEEGISK